jgi:hypothetical protein
MTDPRHQSCPNCGAPVEFTVGASRAVVCAFCKSLVARSGQDLTTVGKVADLIPTGSRLALGVTGKAPDGVRFTLVGRLQYQWQEGVWDEWYVGLADGRWAWLAEAQGRFYFSQHVSNRPVPPAEALKPGASVPLNGPEAFVVTDVKRPTVVGAAGELPFPVPPGTQVLTVDLEGPQGAFATLDFGELGSGEATPPDIYLGVEASFQGLHLSTPEEAPSKGRAADQLRCPKCHAPVTLLSNEQVVRTVCGHCSALLDVSQGALRVLEVLQRRQHDPLIPLGTPGKLGDDAFLVVGWMRRVCVVEGLPYPWDELLLFHPKTQSFTWLVCQDGHWSWVKPVSAAVAHQKQRSFRRFSEVDGDVTEVLGEFTWAVRVGDRAHLVDYIHPPEGLSVETTSDEEVWSEARYLEPSEVEQAFVPARLKLPRRKGVGALQPWPHEKKAAGVFGLVGAGLAAICAVALLHSVLAPHHRLVDASFDAETLSEEQQLLDGGAPSDTRGHSYVSEPFQLRGNEAVEVRLQAAVNNSWAFAGGALVNDDTGEAVPFELEAAPYSGYEGGESWSEGTHTPSTTLSAPPKGTYIARVDLQWDPKLPAPPAMQLAIGTSTFSLWQWLVAVFLLLLPVTLHYMGRGGFETQRWSESNVFHG